MSSSKHFETARASSVAFLIVIALQATFSNASPSPSSCLTDPTLTPSILPYLNATGSVSIPPFVYPTYSQNNNNWTLSTGIYRDNITDPSHSIIKQSFWLDTNPVQDLSSPDLPWMGCGFLLNTPSNARPIVAKSGNGSCDGVLSSTCSAYIQDTAQSAAKGLVGNNGSGVGGNGTSNNACQVIAGAVGMDLGTKCWRGVDSLGNVSQPLFGNPSYPTLATQNTSSCSHNIGNGSSSSAWITGFSTTMDAPADLTAYNKAIKNSSPLLLVGWAKQTVGNGTFAGNGLSGWADTRLVCLTPNQVEKGSVKSGAAKKVRNWRKRGVAACAAAVAAMTFF